MVRLYFYVEGQTEQGYVTRVLKPHLAGRGVQVRPVPFALISTVG